MTKATILIVEDEPDIRVPLREVLDDEGYVVHCAANGSEALELLAGGLRPGLVLLDLMMPVMNGWRFLDALEYDIPIVVISAFLTTAKTMTAAATIRRPVGFMRKPLDLNQLLDFVRDHFSRLRTEENLNEPAG